MSKDVILDQYARLYEIPNQLALLGHIVDCYCLSYQNHNEGCWDESNDVKQLKWTSKSYGGWKKTQIFTYPYTLLKQLKNNNPDLIIAASDIPHIIMGSWLSKQLGIPFVADLYDNFEAYGQAKIPFIKTCFHHALDHACLIVTTSFKLAEKIKLQHPKVSHILPMPSVINQDLFQIADKQQVRKLLNLPLDKKLIGTAGGLTKMKGINDLFNAWEMIRQSQDDIYLVLAGPIEPQTPLPQDDRVIYLGLLQHQDVAKLFQALDVGIMCIPNDEFGKYCFPQKAYEMMACNLSVISSAVGDMAYLLPADHLFSSSEELAIKVIKMLKNPNESKISIPTWQLSIKKINHKLELIFP